MRNVHGCGVRRDALLGTSIFLLVALLCLTANVVGIIDNGNALDEDIVAIPLRRRANTGRRMQSISPFRSVGVTKRESDGVYWATIRLGTPPQSFSVIVDTGSSSIAVPCKGCDCGNHNHFDPSLSSTVQRTGQRYSQCYSEGSCNVGELMSDMACFGEYCSDNQTARHKFGCCDQYASAFKVQDADGIIGLSGSGDTLIAHLRSTNNLRRNMFAFCFGRKTGTFTVGGYYHRPLREDPMWVPLASTGMFYTVQLNGILIGDTMVSSAQTGPLPIIDSGSTFTYFPAAVHSEVTKVFNAYCSSPGHCRGTKNPPGTPLEDIRDSIACYAPPSDVTDIDQWLLANFPTISFAMGAQKLCIPPPTYFFLSKRDVRSYCIGILRDSKFVLGALTMADFSVIFDIENRKVGFARSDCDGNRNVTCCGKECPGSSFVYPNDSPLAPTALFTSIKTEVPGNGTSFDVTPKPTSSLVPSFWEGNVRVVSGLFFFLGIFFALFCAGCFWLCSPSPKSAVAQATSADTPRRSDFQKLSPVADDDAEALTQQ